MPTKVVTVEKCVIWEGPYCEETCEFQEEDAEENEDFCLRYVTRVPAGYARRLLKRDKRDANFRCFRCEPCLKENP